MIAFKSFYIWLLLLFSSFIWVKIASHNKFFADPHEPLFLASQNHTSKPVFITWQSSRSAKYGEIFRSFSLFKPDTFLIANKFQKFWCNTLTTQPMCHLNHQNIWNSSLHLRHYHFEPRNMTKETKNLMLLVADGQCAIFSHNRTINVMSLFVHQKNT